MLKKFLVSNFKNFNKATFELDKPANYEFNSDIIQNGIVTKGILYGINGSGKSNLALAIFDIVLHMTDKERSIEKYILYLNLQSPKPTADFEYIFCFDGVDVIYRYSKTGPMSLSYESLIINDTEVLCYDFSKRVGYTVLKGAETLQLSSSIANDTDKLSRVKYIKNNAILQDDTTNRIFMKFTSFVDNMLMFYSLDQNNYQGLCVGSESFTQGIVREKKVSEFEDFLRKQGVDYSLVTRDMNGQPELFCQYKNMSVPFVAVASTGTRSLALFYYWYIKMSQASLVYIDEYDAFYHFELSQELVKIIKDLTNTQVFLSTHNTDLITNDLLRPDAYFLIQNNQIRSFDAISDKELRRAHNIQKMYKAGAFNE